MKLTASIFIAVVFCSAFFSVDCRAEKDAVISINFAPETIQNLSLSDLDVRDNLNQKIIDSYRKYELEQIFVDGIYNLIAVATPHTLRQAQESFQLFLTLFMNGILNRSGSAGTALSTPAIAPNRGFVHNVYNLWTTGLSANLASCPHPALAVQRSSSLTLPLRC